MRLLRTYIRRVITRAVCGLKNADVFTFHEQLWPLLCVSCSCRTTSRRRWARVRGAVAGHVKYLAASPFRAIRGMHFSTLHQRIVIRNPYDRRVLSLRSPEACRPLRLRLLSQAFCERPARPGTGAEFHRPPATPQLYLRRRLPAST